MVFFQVSKQNLTKYFLSLPFLKEMISCIIILGQYSSLELYIYIYIV